VVGPQRVDVDVEHPHGRQSTMEGPLNPD
jgi:hypothetical protein